MRYWFDLLLSLNNVIWPSLSLEAIRVSNNQKNLLVETDDSGIKIIKTRKNIFRTDKNGIINIKFKRFKEENYISAIDIINNDYKKEKIKDKIILIGSSAQGLFDIVKISNGRVIPGVEVHAHIISNIINNDSIIKNAYTRSAENVLFFFILMFLVMVPKKVEPKFSFFIFLIFQGFSKLLQSSRLICRFFQSPEISKKSNNSMDFYRANKICPLVD